MSAASQQHMQITAAHLLLRCHAGLHWVGLVRVLQLSLALGVVRLLGAAGRLHAARSQRLPVEVLQGQAQQAACQQRSKTHSHEIVETCASLAVHEWCVLLMARSMCMCSEPDCWKFK